MKLKENKKLDVGGKNDKLRDSLANEQYLHFYRLQGYIIFTFIDPDFGLYIGISRKVALIN